MVNDSPGFYTSRIFCAYVDEAMAMLAEGVKPALIENAARMAGMAVSPLAVLDEVSLDPQQRVVRQAEADGVPEPLRRIHAQPVIARMNAIDRLAASAAADSTTTRRAAGSTCGRDWRKRTRRRDSNPDWKK
ncbi:3-hydroxyacyl-CoA dehydrogenase family protein [Cupriavidus basilensis]